MGCFQSKKDSGDIHPNVFRVVNVDEDGAALWSGQLEITETELILYRAGRDATYWPLASLRRYGFEGEIFSFESGRRCATGEGIYAFRCRRAAILFHVLQSNIQLRNVIQESLPFQLPSTLLTGSPPTLPRQTLQASVVHRSSIDNGQPSRPATSNNLNLNNHMQLQTGVTRTSAQHRTPSTSDILEVMPLYPRPQNNTSQVTNVYQVKDFKAKENNNNQGEQSSNNRHMYSNDFNRDLAMLRNTLRQEADLNMRKDIEDEKQFRYKNENFNSNRAVAPLSPTLSNASEHYAQLSIEQQEAARHYMNLLPSDGNVADLNKNEVMPGTPLTPKQPEYCNFGPSTILEMNSYANLTLGENANNVKNLLCRSIDMQKFTDDSYASMSPVEEMEVNYAVLDIDTNKEGVKTVTRDVTSPENVFLSKNDVSSSSQSSTHTRGRQVSQGSSEKATTPPATMAAPLPGSVGYTTIDFDKTVALTSVAANAEDGSRKTRHNSVCGSPNSTDRNK